MSEADPRLDAALARLAEDVDESGAEQRLVAARATVEADSGLLSRVRSLPTPVRVALAGFALGLLALVIVLVNAREDLQHYPALRLGMEAALSAGAALMLAAVALRGPHRPAPGAGFTWVLGLVALAVPLGLALVPPADLMLPGAKGGEGTFARDAAACFVYGLAAALPVLGVLALLQRMPPTAPRVAAMAAAGAGLGGVLALQMHCPIAVRDHLIVGHATVPLATLLVVLVVRRVRGEAPQ